MTRQAIVQARGSKGHTAPNWTVYRTKEPCECGGKYTARAFLDDRVLSS